MPQELYVQHPSPVWKDRANFVLRAKTRDSTEDRDVYEHLWARWIEGFEFEICCVPFLTYGLALGDRVQADADATFEETLERSGRRCVRAWIEDPTVPREDVVNALVEENLLHEWNGQRHIAIDLPDPNAFQRFTYRFNDWRRDGRVLTEDGN